MQGRYQKYQPETQQFSPAVTLAPTNNPAKNQYNIDRLEEQRRQLAKQREEHARRLKVYKFTVNKSLFSFKTNVFKTTIKQIVVRSLN